MEELYSYILSEETRYQTIPVPVIEGYEWSMFEHCRRTMMYLNSRYDKGKFGDNPFRNIILDKVNLQHRAIDIDVSEVQAYVDSPEEFYKSFLVRKYHDKWARKVNLGEFFNELGEVWTDYGGAIIKNCYDGSPKVVQFNTLAFVDQTNIAAGPICEKHYFTPDELKEYDGKWNTEMIDTVIVLASERNQEKQTQRTKQRKQTPTAYIEVYELHGVLPESYLYEDGDEHTYVRQMHVVAYYNDKDGKKCGVSLYSGKESKSPYKVAIRDKISGRGLGRGGVEELFEAQLWVNYNEILQKNMLDQASRIIYQTADPAFTTRNQTRNSAQGQVFVHEEGKPLSQINTNPVNVQLFEQKLEQWNESAKTISSTFDSVSGEESKSGLPFRLGLLQNQEAHSLHAYRKEKVGLFLQEVYRDWVLPYFSKEICKGDTFLTQLSLDELESVVEQVLTNEVNGYIKEKLFNLEVPDVERIKLIEETTRSNFRQGGGKKFIKIFKDEMKDLPIDVEVVFTTESKNNAFVAEKLSSVFAQLAQNPAVLEDARMQKLFNEILEASGLSPMEFATMRKSEKPTQVQPDSKNVAPARPISALEQPTEDLLVTS